MSGVGDREKLSCELSSVFFISIISTMIFGLGVYVFSDKIALALTSDGSSGFFFKFVILMILSRVSHAFFKTFIRAKKEFKVFSIIEISNYIFELLFIFVLLKWDFGLIGVIIGFVLARVLLIFFELIFIRKYVGVTLPRFSKIKKYISFGLPLTITPLLFWIILSSDQYIIGFFHGAKLVGVYALAYSLSRLIRTVADPILLLLQPSLASSWNNGSFNEMKMYFNYSYKYIFMVAIPAIFGISFLAKHLILIISTPEFIGGVYIIPIVGLGFLFYLFFMISFEIFMLKKETKQLTGVLILLAIFNIVLNIILVPIFANMGAAVSTLLSFFIAGSFGLYKIKKFGFNIMPGFLLKSLFSAMVMGLFLFFVRNFNLGNIYLSAGFMVVIGAIIYFVILYLIKGIEKSEIKFFLNLLKKDKIDVN
jgi:O-antigen/teichoic acid export membrane protein